MAALDQRGVELGRPLRLELRQGVGRHLERGVALVGRPVHRVHGAAVLEEGRVVRRQRLRGQVLAGLGVDQRDPRVVVAALAQQQPSGVDWARHSGTRSSRVHVVVPSVASHAGRRLRRSLSSESWSQRWTWPTKRSWKPMTSGGIDPLAVPHRRDRAARKQLIGGDAPLCPRLAQHGQAAADQRDLLDVQAAGPAGARRPAVVVAHLAARWSRLRRRARSRDRGPPRRPGRPGACRGGGDRGQARAAAGAGEEAEEGGETGTAVPHTAQNRASSASARPHWVQCRTLVPLRSAANAPGAPDPRAGRGHPFAKSQPRREIFTRAAQYRPACSRAHVAVLTMLYDDMPTWRR